MWQAYRGERYSQWLVSITGGARCFNAEGERDPQLCSRGGHCDDDTDLCVCAEGWHCGYCQSPGELEGKSQCSLHTCQHSRQVDVLTLTQVSVSLPRTQRTKHVSTRGHQQQAGPRVLHVPMTRVALVPMMCAPAPLVGCAPLVPSKSQTCSPHEVRNAELCAPKQSSLTMHVQQVYRARQQLAA